MFGYFMYGQPMFADVPVFAASGSGGAGGGGGKRKRQERKSFENQVEVVLISFLNVIE